MVFTESQNEDEFIRAHGGTYALSGNKYVENIEIASWEDFGKEKTDFTFEIDGNKFHQEGTVTLSDGTILNIDEVWQKVTTANTFDHNPSVGTWDQLSSSYTLADGTKGFDTNATASRFQIITPTHWMRISHRDKKFENLLGGTYNINGDKFYANFEFSSNPSLRFNEAVIDQKVEGDELSSILKLYEL